MEFIILICLINYLHCYFYVYHLKKYDWNYFSDDTHPKGIIALSLSEFDIGDTIYITFTSYNDKHIRTLNYSFDNEVSDTESKNNLNETTNPYSENNGVETEKSSWYKFSVSYYEYYYKFIIPNNKIKTNYLLMRFDLSKTKISKFKYENTRFARHIVTIIITVSCSIGVILIVLLILLCKFRKRIKSFCKRKYNLNSSSFDINDDNIPENPVYPSSNSQISQIEYTPQEDIYPEKDQLAINSVTDKFIERPYDSEYNCYDDSAPSPANCSNPSE